MEDSTFLCYSCDILQLKIFVDLEVSLEDPEGLEYVGGSILSLTFPRFVQASFML